MLDYRTNSNPPPDALGHVHSVSGSQATVGILAATMDGPHRASITVGKFLKIQTARSVLVGVITNVSIQTSSSLKDQGYRAVANIDLMGEIGTRGGAMFFRRGVGEYPTIGDLVVPLNNNELRTVFDDNNTTTIRIGNLQQDHTVGACIDVDEMLNKHFAVLGSTGVGKSSAVAQILLRTMQARPDLRIFLLDAHNEYGRCFGACAQVVNPGNLRLPFWLFNFEEIVDVFFAGRPGLQEEVEILSEVIPLAKTNYTLYKTAPERPGLKKIDPKSIGYTVDTPVPYRLADLVALIDERMGKLENRSSRMNYHKLITRIETVSNDPRYGFMFENANVGGDTMAEAISQLFRLPAEGRTMTIMQLAGFPAEVVDAVVSVLSRLAYDFGLWSDGVAPLLFVCEEAHKYASADRTAGFAPTRRAISRIAKEGRKYGVFLGLVTQRPAELDPTIISQCGTLFAMRMSNDHDQALLRSAVSDTAANLFSFVPSLGTREALAFGAGIPLPTRLTFEELAQANIPRSEAFANNAARQDGVHDINFITAVVERWRGATMSQKSVHADPAREAKTPGLDIPPVHAAPPLQPAPAPAAAPQPATNGAQAATNGTLAGLDPNRFSLLKKPASDQPDPYAALRRPVAPAR